MPVESFACADLDRNGGGCNHFLAARKSPQMRMHRGLLKTLPSSRKGEALSGIVFLLYLTFNNTNYYEIHPSLSARAVPIAPCDLTILSAPLSPASDVNLTSLLQTPDDTLIIPQPPPVSISDPFDVSKAVYLLHFLRPFCTRAASALVGAPLVAFSCSCLRSLRCVLPLRSPRCLAPMSVRPAFPHAASVDAALSPVRGARS